MYFVRLIEPPVRMVGQGFFFVWSFDAFPFSAAIASPSPSPPCRCCSRLFRPPRRSLRPLTREPSSSTSGVHTTLMKGQSMARPRIAEREEIHSGSAAAAATIHASHCGGVATRATSCKHCCCCTPRHQSLGSVTGWVLGCSHRAHGSDPPPSSAASDVLAHAEAEATRAPMSALHASRRYPDVCWCLALLCYARVQHGSCRCGQGLRDRGRRHAHERRIQHPQPRCQQAVQNVPTQREGGQCEQRTSARERTRRHDSRRRTFAAARRSQSPADFSSGCLRWSCHPLVCDCPGRARLSSPPRACRRTP